MSTSETSSQWPTTEPGRPNLIKGHLQSLLSEARHALLPNDMNIGDFKVINLDSQEWSTYDDGYGYTSIVTILADALEDQISTGLDKVSIDLSIREYGITISSVNVCFSERTPLMQFRDLGVMGSMCIAFRISKDQGDYSLAKMSREDKKMCDRILARISDAEGAQEEKKMNGSDKEESDDKDEDDKEEDDEDEEKFTDALVNAETVLPPPTTTVEQHITQVEASVVIEDDAEAESASKNIDDSPKGPVESSRPSSQPRTIKDIFIETTNSFIQHLQGKSVAKADSILAEPTPVKEKAKQEPHVQNSPLEKAPALKVEDQSAVVVKVEDTTPRFDLKLSRENINSKRQLDHDESPDKGSSPMKKARLDITAEEILTAIQEGSSLLESNISREQFSVALDSLATSKGVGEQQPPAVGKTATSHNSNQEENTPIEESTPTEPHVAVFTGTQPEVEMAGTEPVPLGESMKQAIEIKTPTPIAGEDNSGDAKGKMIDFSLTFQGSDEVLHSQLQSPTTFKEMIDEFTEMMLQSQNIEPTLKNNKTLKVWYDNGVEEIRVHPTDTPESLPLVPGEVKHRLFATWCDDKIVFMVYPYRSDLLTAQKANYRLGYRKKFKSAFKRYRAKVSHLVNASTLRFYVKRDGYFMEVSQNETPADVGLEPEEMVYVMEGHT